MVTSRFHNQHRMRTAQRRAPGLSCTEQLKQVISMCDQIPDRIGPGSDKSGWQLHKERGLFVASGAQQAQGACGPQCELQSMYTKATSLQRGMFRRLARDREEQKVASDALTDNSILANNGA
jgi:hypothetical protein